MFVATKVQLSTLLELSRPFIEVVKKKFGPTYHPRVSDFNPGTPLNENQIREIHVRAFGTAYTL
jgi:hypothetical protein